MVLQSCLGFILGLMFPEVFIISNIQSQWREIFPQAEGNSNIATALTTCVKTADWVQLRKITKEFTIKRSTMEVVTRC